MPLTEPNFKMIEIARHIRGVTQSELAESLNITQSNLSKVEAGLLGVTDNTISEIGKVLNFPVSFFYQEEVRTPISNIYFRKRASISQKELDRIIGDVKTVLKCVDYLLEDIDIIEYPKYKFDLSDGWTPESIAIRFREILKIPSGSIHEPIKYLEEIGIIVYFYDCNEPKFDGLTAYTDKGTPVIFINKNLSNDRIKFTLAHELFHLIAHIPCDVEPWRDFEAEANQFPGEFYMPTKESMLSLQHLTFNQLTGLKAYWGLSKSAIIYKAKSHGFINEKTYKYMIVELSRRGERKIESGFVEIDKPTILQQVLDLLNNELDYSDQEIADKICLGIEDFLRLFKPDLTKSPIVRLKQPRVAI